MISKGIKDSLIEVLKDLGISVPEEQVVLEHPADLGFGDYSTSIAMVISAKRKAQSAKPKLKVQNFRAENSKEIAEQIKIKWQEIGLPDFVEKIEVAGPGFINIWLKFDALGSQLNGLLKEGDGFGRSEWGKGKTMVIDYSAPNIAKPFGIGHLRSTNIGQALYNIYKFLGWKTIGDNHLGDWGTQFGKLISQIELKVQSFDGVYLERSRETQDKSSKACPELAPYRSGTGLVEGFIVDKEEFLGNLTIEELERLYVEFHKEAETHPEMEEEARKWFKKLEEGDLEARKIWQACVNISLKEFDRIYKLLGVRIDYAYGESFYLDKMGEVLEDCRKKGILKKSQGALVVEIPGETVPAMLVKSDGATTYLLRDLAAIKFRVKQWKPDLIVYEVGADQTLHFAQLFNIATQLGYGQLNTFVHIAHGLIRWSSGKFSTRRGKTIHLEDILDEAIKKAKKLSSLSSRRVANNSAIADAIVTSCDSVLKEEDDTKNEDRIAKAVGIGAIKYNDLKQNPKTDIVFDWDQMLTLSGNSGPYLQYTYARVESVKRKAQSAKPNLKTENFNNITIQPSFAKATAGRQLSSEEISIMRTIYRFPEVIEQAAKEFSPNLLCNFVFDLCQKFNLFYDKHRILTQISNLKSQNHISKLKTKNESEVTEEQSRFRLLLTAAVGQILKNGLRLLGIEALEKM